MATTSRLPAFEAALLDALRDSIALRGVQVEGYWPGPETESEGIYAGDWDSTDVGSGEMTPRTITTGRQPRDERAESAWTLQTWQPDAGIDGLPEAKERLWELFGAVEDVIADDPSVTGTVSFFDAYRYRVRQVPAGGGWAVRMSLYITYRARLT